MPKPAIVIAAYDRPASLTRLLASLRRAEYPEASVALVISIDGGEKQSEVKRIAEEFEWQWGAKDVIAHTEKKGLRKHILACGDLSEFFEAVILLEDDLFVSPFFYLYTKRALDQFSESTEIAGISLYHHSYNETAGLAFEPFADGYDNYFLQLPSSWGQCWTREQWLSFRAWYALNSKIEVGGDAAVPANVAKWSQESWKKYFLQYMVEQNLYFSYPRNSLTTNFSDPGTHHKCQYNHLQVPLLYYPKEFRLSSLGASRSVYDAFCEPSPAVLCNSNESLRPYRDDLIIDLYGTKPLGQVSAGHVVTCRDAQSGIRSWGRQLKPHECNVIFDNPGDDFILTTTDAVSGCADRKYFESLNYYNSVSPISYRLAIHRELEAAYQAELDAVYRSRSWRLTAPLRKLASLVRSE